MLYPIGIQDFEKIRRAGYVYVDKTDLVFSSMSMKRYSESQPPQLNIDLDEK